jgi:hypothetical protein
MNLQCVWQRFLRREDERAPVESPTMQFDVLDERRGSGKLLLKSVFAVTTVWLQGLGYSL